jgi:hypothetical protein
MLQNLFLALFGCRHPNDKRSWPIPCAVVALPDLTAARQNPKTTQQLDQSSL